MPCPSGGTVWLSTPGQVLENVSLDHCEIAVNTTGAIIRNVKLNQTAPELWAIWVGSGDVTISDTEVYGNGTGQTSVQYAVYLRDQARATIQRVNFHHCADCVQGEHVVLKDSWFHTFANIAGVSHVDGFQCNSTCDGTVIDHNFIDVDQDQTGAVSLFQDFGIPRNVLVQNNWLRGAGWTIYGGAGTRGTPTNIRILNNTVDPGQYGWMAYWNASGAGNVATGNHTSSGTPLVP